MRIIFSIMALLISSFAAQASDIRIASKQNTESVVLTEILRAVAKIENIEAEHLYQLGGTRVVWEALLRGDIDAYVDYTGTLSLAILRDKKAADLASIRTRLDIDFGLAVSDPLGFENSYAIGIGPEIAQKTGAQTISDLVNFPELKFGFSFPFMDRDDGWRGLRQVYGLHQQPRTVEHELGYRGVGSGQLAGMDVYTTDPEILLYDMTVLKDDKGYFPDYSAVIVYRKDLAEKHPKLAAAFENLSGKIPADTMRQMNRAAKIDLVPAETIAEQYVKDTFGQSVTLERESRIDIILRAIGEHMILVSVSLLIAMFIALPLGVVAFLKPKFGAAVLAVVAVLQTVPSLALFVFMIPVVGIGAAPAIIALFVYSLLPIVRNTHAGLVAVPFDVRRSAIAMGLPLCARLKYVDLPVALPTILAGIKTAAVINVGTATLGALIGAGGLGEPILTGIRLADNSFILAGAVPAAIMALLVQYGFEMIERRLASV